MTTVKLGDCFELELPFEVTPDKVVDLPGGSKCEIYKATKRSWSDDDKKIERDAWRLHFVGPELSRRVVSFNQDMIVDEPWEVNSEVTAVALRLLKRNKTGRDED